MRPGPRSLEPDDTGVEQLVTPTADQMIGLPADGRGGSAISANAGVAAERDAQRVRE